MTQDVSTEIEVGGAEWRELVQRARSLVSRNNWNLGDTALRIAPIGERGGDYTSFDTRVSKLREEKLRRFAEETEIPYQSLRAYRFTASRWPEGRRLSLVSHRAHVELQGLPDRFDLIRPGLTVTEARELAHTSTSGRGGLPAPTLIGLLNELAECRRRVQATFRLAVPMSLSEAQKGQLLDDLTEIRYITDQFYSYLTGESLNDTIEKILQEDSA